MSLSVRTRRTVGDSYAGHDAGNVDRADAENEGVHLVSSFHGFSVAKWYYINYTHLFF